MRKIIAVVLGVIVANVVFFLVSVAADRFYPTPPELMDPQTPEATALRVASAEAVGLVLVLLGAVLGGLAGGFTGARLAKTSAFIVVSAIAALQSLWAVYSFYVFYPDRLWFPAGMLVAFLIATYAGGFVGRRSRRKEQN
jgi:hypothetical protein